MNPYLSISPEIEKALAEGKPVVALESTILSHGMPFPENVEFSHKVEEIVRGEGAIPATTAIIGGKLKVGLTADELDLMCRAENVGKVSRRDVAVYLATGKTGATTVATTMMLAEMAGIKVFATGGIGGVHRGAELTFDISADLQELAATKVAVVCAGAKSLLDIPKTLNTLRRWACRCWAWAPRISPPSTAAKAAARPTQRSTPRPKWQRFCKPNGPLA